MVLLQFGYPRELNGLGRQIERAIPKLEAGEFSDAELAECEAFSARFNSEEKELPDQVYRMRLMGEFTARCREIDPSSLRTILDVLGLPRSEGGLSD